jgi:hypothetical protein
MYLWLAALTLAGMGIAPAAEPIPPVSGELTGEITPLKLAGAPTFKWKLVVAGTDPHSRLATLSAEGPGTALDGTVQFDAAKNAAWKIGTARLELETWTGGMAPHLPPEMKDLKLQGTLQFSGDGTWNNGEFAGRGRFTLERGRLDDPTHKLVLEGISLDLWFEDLARVRSAPRQVLAWSGGRFDEMEVGPGRVEFSMADDRVRVDAATIAIFGGEIRLAAFEFSRSRLEIAVDARVVGIDVGKLLPLLPRVLAEASGRLNGTLQLRRDASGVQIGAGRLALEPGRTAEVRFEPTPGLLSRSLPATVLKYYPGLGQIETGEIPITANLLEISFSPEGDSEGRTAYIHLAGGPQDPRLRAPIDLQINVRGPLEQLVKLGTSGRLRFGN